MIHNASNFRGTARLFAETVNDNVFNSLYIPIKFMHDTLTIPSAKSW